MNKKLAFVPTDYSPVSNEVIRKADVWALDHDVELFFLYVQAVSYTHLTLPTKTIV